MADRNSSTKLVTEYEATTEASGSAVDAIVEYEATAAASGSATDLVVDFETTESSTGSTKLLLEWTPPPETARSDSNYLYVDYGGQLIGETSVVSAVVEYGGQLLGEFSTAKLLVEFIPPEDTAVQTHIGGLRRPLIGSFTKYSKKLG